MFTKPIGIGLAAAVLIDATVVSMVLVPAVMQLMGERKWWLPGLLDRVIPEVELEGAAGGDAIAPGPTQRLGRGEGRAPNAFGNHSGGNGNRGVAAQQTPLPPR